VRTDELDFVLPPELIAQQPVPDRAQSRLLHYRRSAGTLADRHFADMPDLLRPGDLLIMNDARVVPARFSLLKPGGGHVEGLFIEQISPGRWRVMLKNVGAPRPEIPLHFLADPDYSLYAISKDAEGHYEVRIDPEVSALELLERIGRMPLPPYIHRTKDHDDRDTADRERYQTVFAGRPCAVAAPTAGLHFTPELIARLTARGIRHAFLTLHVGLGTFKPVTVDRLEEHPMHVETYSIPPATADALNAARQEGRRIIAVGTTSARVLESQRSDQPIRPLSGQTGIFILPPYQWKYVDALITNFHLPRSTLIALVAAMVGLDQQRMLYQHAIAARYRFFSYGDAMFIE
jgi:S-adenosylmethionine:tRNA ribosyltransferase-isomerase